jgi:hypothetical protein
MRWQALLLSLLGPVALFVFSALSNSTVLAGLAVFGVGIWALVVAWTAFRSLAVRRDQTSPRAPGSSLHEICARAELLYAGVQSNWPKATLRTPEVRGLAQRPVTGM